MKRKNKKQNNILKKKYINIIRKLYNKNKMQETDLGDT